LGLCVGHQKVSREEYANLRKQKKSEAQGKKTDWSSCKLKEGGGRKLSMKGHLADGPPRCGSSTTSKSQTKKGERGVFRSRAKRAPAAKEKGGL